MSNTQGSFTFDGPNKIISCTLGTLTFSAAELYSRWKDWLVDDPERFRFEPAFSGSVGGEPLGGGVFVGGYFFLQNGWVVRPQEADHQLIVSGNLYPIPETANLFTSTLGDFQVIVGMRTSSLTQKVVTSNGSGGGGTGPTAEEIAEAVWNEDISQATEGAGRNLKEVTTNTGLIPGLL